MVRFFQTYHPSIAVVLVLLAVGLRVSYSLAANPEGLATHDGPLAQLVFAGLKLLPGGFELWSAVLGTALVIGQAFYLNNLFNRYRLLRHPSYLSAALTLLLSFIGSSFCSLTAALMANIFLFWSFGKVVSLYRQEQQAASVVLDAALLVGLASLWYPPYLYFVVFLIFALAFWIPFHTRAYLMVIVGAALPYYLLGAYYFWQGKLAELWSLLGRAALPPVSQAWSQQLWGLWVPAATVSAVVLWSFVYLQENLFRMVVQMRLFLLTVLVFLLCGVLLVMVHPQIMPQGLTWSVLPAAVALTLFVAEFRWRWLAEAYLLFLFLWALGAPYLQ
ncbi:MAG: hypothetical protein NZL95_00975 [Chitinophagales bacterium]|nr:hypothetical protein [Chitinophagales bacterium]MDW8427108.1 hypothetical protein [Chitinophagales bacterium]